MSYTMCDIKKFLQICVRIFLGYVGRTLIFIGNNARSPRFVYNFLQEERIRHVVLPSKLLVLNVIDYIGKTVDESLSKTSKDYLRH